MTLIYGIIECILSNTGRFRWMTGHIYLFPYVFCFLLVYFTAIHIFLFHYVIVIKYFANVCFL